MNICRICNNIEGNTTYVVSEMMFGTRKDFNYFECKNCNCLQIEKFPEHIESFYPSDYYSYDKLDESKYTGIKGILKLLVIKNHVFSKSLKIKSTKIGMYNVLGKLGISKNTRILDVGAGNGQFLYPLSKLGFINLLSVVPYISESFEYSKLYKVVKSDLAKVGDIWDIITFCHSFEHIWEIDETLKNVKQLLEPNGYCLISVPLANSVAWKEFQTYWYQIDAPRHFHLHSKKSMEILANRNEFEIVDTIFNSNYLQFYISDLYKKGKRMIDMQKHKGNKILWKIKKFQYIKRAIEANLNKNGDQAIFILKRK